MNKVNFVNDRQDCQRGHELPDGRIVVIVNTDSKLEMRYDTPFNLETGEIAELPENAPKNGKDGIPDYAPDGYTTLNNLSAQGIGKTVTCFDEYKIKFPRNVHTLSEQGIQSIIDKFAKNGFKVTHEAIKHNFEAWLRDHKSGYRDDENGYHLFTPCGCNPLSFNATTLSDNCDWQTTYEC